MQTIEHEELIRSRNNQVVNLNDKEEEFDMSCTQSQKRKRQTPSSTQKRKKLRIANTSEVREGNEMKGYFLDFSKIVREVISEMTSHFSTMAGAMTYKTEQWKRICRKWLRKRRSSTFI